MLKALLFPPGTQYEDVLGTDVCGNPSGQHQPGQGPPRTLWWNWGVSLWDHGAWVVIICTGADRGLEDSPSPQALTASLKDAAGPQPPQPAERTLGDVSEEGGSPVPDPMMLGLLWSTETEREEERQRQDREGGRRGGPWHTLRGAGVQTAVASGHPGRPSGEAEGS